MIAPSTLKDEERILYNRILEISQRGIISDNGCFTGFLNPREQNIANIASKNNGLFFGGHNSAERKMLGVFSNGSDDMRKYFPIKAVRLIHKLDGKLDHRAILGTLMSLGISRSNIGDIISHTNYSIIICNDFTQQVLLADLSKIGHTGVRTDIECLDNVTTNLQFMEISGTISSVRLDNLVALLANSSRSKSEEFFKAEKVLHNYTEPSRMSIEFCEGDIVTIRGLGKFIVDKIGGNTRKGRIPVTCRRYL